MKTVRRRGQEIGRILRFGLVGALATLAHLGVGQTVLASFGTPYLANFLGYASGAALSFVGHFYFTFAPRRRKREAFPRFLAVNLLALLTSSLLLYAMETFLGAVGSLEFAIAVLVIPAVTYAGYHLWAFR